MVVNLDNGVREEKPAYPGRLYNPNLSPLMPQVVDCYSIIFFPNFVVSKMRCKIRTNPDKKVNSFKVGTHYNYYVKVAS